LRRKEGETGAETEVKEEGEGVRIIMGNCQALPCTESDADKKKTGDDGVQEVVEEVETLEAQASAKSGKLVSVSINASSKGNNILPGASRTTTAKSMKSMKSAKSTPNSSKKTMSNVSLPASESMKSVEGEEGEEAVEVGLDAVGSGVDVTLIANGIDDTPPNGTAHTSFKSVSFSSDGEQYEETDAGESNVLVSAYLYVFDTVFNVLLSVLSSLAAIMHMLTKSSGLAIDNGKAFLKWPEIMPISRIATQKFSEYFGIDKEE